MIDYEDLLKAVKVLSVSVCVCSCSCVHGVRLGVEDNGQPQMSFLGIYSVCTHVCTSSQMPAAVLVWRSEDNQWKLVLPVWVPSIHIRSPACWQAPLPAELLFQAGSNFLMFLKEFWCKNFHFLRKKLIWPYFSEHE